jgi:tetratricopeptide (TPR) repeat protein
MKEPLISLLRNNSGLLALLFVSFLIYVPSLSGDFVVDDTPVIKNNTHIRDSSHFADFFRKGFWENTALEDKTIAMYRPMVLVFFSLNHGISGNDPFGYHVTLLLLHLANILLVYALIRKLTAGSAIGAIVGASFFALHPTRVESVAWLSGITDPLVIFFLLGSLLAHRIYIENPKGWWYLAVSMLCFQLALWSKEVAIAFPLVVLAHDLIYRRKINWPEAFLHAGLVSVYMVARNVALGELGKPGVLDLSQFSRAVDFLLGYSQLLVFPGQIPFYIQPPGHPVSSALGWIGAITIILLVGYSSRTFDQDRRKSLAFSAIWIAVFSWPAILMMFYMDGFYSARFLYVPAVGVAIFLSDLYNQVNETHPGLKIPILTSCLLVIALYGFFTSKEIPSWQDNEAIYRKVARLAPESASGYSGLAQYYLLKEDYAAAEKNFLIVLQKAKSPKVRVEALVALGTIRGMSNDLVQSQRYLEEAVQIEPNNSDVLAGLGNLALMNGQVNESISYYEKALTARPGNYEAAMNLALAYEKTGQIERSKLVRRTVTEKR